MSNQTIHENQNKCRYLDSNTMNSADMLKTCKSTNSETLAPCHKNYNSLQLPQRNIIPASKLFDGNDFTKYNDEKKIPGKGVKSGQVIEGFTDYTGPGESFVQTTCPESMSLNPYTNECEKLCKNCKISDKSFEFNEFDPCFPSGVYDGINNKGETMCTCGNRGQYCTNDTLNNIITADGNFINNGISMIVGNLSGIFSEIN